MTVERRWNLIPERVAELQERVDKLLSTLNVHECVAMRDMLSEALVTHEEPPTNRTEEHDDGYEGGCQNCGRLIDKGAKGYDDIVSSPYVTESGDLYCIPCGRAQDQAEREREEEDGFGDYDPYDAAGESLFSLPGGGKSL